MVVITTVSVTAQPGGPSSFDCPNCERRISFANRYPFSFMWKVCPRCRWQWTPTDRGGIGPCVDDLTEPITRDLSVGSLGRSVDES